MSFELDEDILQDFLVEAGEILELLSEQLIELENNPEDSDLLNAIFRGFHTVKGGAGFLAMTELVDACHGAENVFDILRQGQLSVTPELMDVILQALDCINVMFACIQNREKPEPADPSLLKAMHQLCKGESNKVTPPEIEPQETQSPAESLESDDVLFDMDDTSTDDSSIDDISEDEFENLLDELHGAGKGPIIENKSETSADTSDGDITDDQFENLLDELHGVGSFGETENPQKTPEKNNVVSPDMSSDSEDISDDEFEALLDELHGKGQEPKSVEPSTQKNSVAVNKPKVVKKEQAIPKPKVKPEIESKPKVESKPATQPKSPDKPAAKTPAVQAETTVRVDTKRLDQIMNMVGELVLVRNRLVSLGATNSSESMNKAISNLDVVTADLQSAVMKTRMQPIKKVFGRFPRVVRDLARSLKKDINLQLVGEDTDLDKNLVEALADPLVHLVRNSVDHGIEMPDEREASGKSRTGTVTLSASQEGDHILLTIEDDGAGMDPNKLKDIAIGKGVIDADFASRMTDNEAFNLIFAPGFSTKEEISDISGRGVGMDVVKTKITQLNGSINIESKQGTGTSLEIKVPLTLAILPTLMVLVEEQTFALPLACVNEIFHLDLSKTNIVDGQLTIIVRDKAIPLFYLESWLVKNPSSVSDQRSGDGHVVIVQLGTQQVGFAVDSLIGQEEVVIKPLDALLQGTPGMAGATITSDGGIALILDVPNLLKHYAGKVK
ncbi:chemotaxis protein CheA [Pseudoalteromonas sp. NBT06-2]|uniref:chemotaxis protein CheA n=1 Tax=Pseudoalteromonas sp. NBT06-2 TaxID=2025950 RepID=UPI000BA52168|nr:chemotaxis protein CheA [Pseudoalteromonas sp. NBT06-2]PAJ74653.1 chemotaxis protein CheA [Pseudoalteromonas sp. NBT06-2]